MELIFKFCIFLPIIQLIFLIMALIYQNIKLIYYLTRSSFHVLRQILRPCCQQAVQMRILRKMVDKWDNHIPIKQKPLTGIGIGNIRKLVRGNIQLLCQNLPVSCGLVEHIDKITVLKNVLDLPRGKQVFDVLGDACWDTAPFSEPLPDFHAVSCCLFLLQEK